MKKAFRFLTLLLAVTMLFSSFSVLSFAEETAERTFTEIVKMTFDDLGLSNGDVYKSTGTNYYPKWPDSFISIGGYASSVSVDGIKSSDDFMGKGVNTANDSNVTYIVLPDINKTKTEEVVALRNGDTALAFDFIMTDNLDMKVMVNGEYNSANYTTTIMEIKKENKIINYSYTAGTSTYKAYGIENLFKRDNLHKVKFIFKSATGTYDVYFDGVKINENLSLAGPNKLLKLYIQFFAKNDTNIGVSHIDNIAYYALGNDDAAAQTTYTTTANGTVIPEKDITKAGETQKFAITPDEGYEIGKIIFNGVEVKNYNRAGFTYETPVLTSEGGVLNVEFRQERTFGKAFEINFDNYEKDAVLIDTLNDGIASNQSSISFSTGSANIFIKEAVLSANEEAPGKNSLKVYSTGESSATMYTFIDKNAYADTVKDDFAIAFRVNVSEGSNFRYTMRNHNETGSRTVIETTEGIFKVYGQVYDSNGKRGYKTYTTALRPIDGKYHDYKLIFKPSAEQMDVYVDNVCVIKNVEMPDSDQFFYNVLQINGAKNNGMTAFIDNYECYALTSADVNAQLNVNCQDGEFIADKTVTSAGENVSFTVNPIRGKKVNELKHNGQVLTAVDGVYEIPALSSKENNIDVNFGKIRVLSERFSINFDEFSEGQVLVNTYNDEKIGNQLSVNLYKEGTKVTSNIWVTDAIASAVKEADGDIAMKIETKKPVENVNNAGGFSFYSFLENEDKSLYKETTSDLFAITFRLKMEEGQTGRMLINDATDIVKGRTILTVRANDLVFYDYYMKDGALKYSTKIFGGVHDNEYHDYKLVFNPKENTYDVYIDNILVAENFRNPDVTQYYYVCFQMYGNAEKDLTLYLDDYTCYEMAADDEFAQIKGTVSGKGKIITDKLITEFGENVAVQVVPAAGSFAKNISVNGKNIPAFDSDLTYRATVDAGKVISAEFYGYTENAPAIVTTGYAVKEDNKIYLFNKLIANGTEVSEFGMLFSKTNKNPAIGGNDVSVITYAKELGNYGYHGYMLYNGTGNDELSFYVRPYAKVGTTIYYGDIKEVNTLALESVK